ncbi:hypothetical protein BSU04_46125 [Caballeronia sordidicola]|uniref:Uncharacterized protein n=1 Tax=Caballeronia sordidicola TaxID=196367 RepID=A0A226WK58_CABSO|nr:hypothetical protein BSU04_46125 [Caballeronia sordidicola]
MTFYRDTVDGARGGWPQRLRPWCPRCPAIGRTDERIGSGTHGLVQVEQT